MNIPKLMLKDSLSGSKKIFSLQDNPIVNIYICGVTPYAPSHLGHGRSYINFDVLVRVLKYLNIQTHCIRNFTDIDDKLLNVAEKEYGDKHQYPTIADRFIKDFKEQMTRLNCLAPDIEPLATKSIPQIVSLIEKLMIKGFAYKSGLDIFFDISKFQDYGKLSKKNINDLVAGCRVSINEEKRNPLDFVLWKGNDLSEFWNTTLGWGRPGWHIECSAMIAANTDRLDIHGGGADLVFPHHENEIAQSEAATGNKLAECWLHNGLLNISSEKMSKSGNNSMTMDHFFKTTDPQNFRYYILQHHYRSPIDFSPEKLLDAKKSRDKLAELKKITLKSDLEKKEQQNFEAKSIIVELQEALYDDLNTAKCLGLIFKHYDVIKNNYFLAREVINILESCFGLVLSPSTEDNSVLPDEIRVLIEKRNAAREEKNWIVADKIREQLKILGYKQSDEKK